MTSRRQVREGLALLGIRRLLLGVHDAAFPSSPEEDVGRGTPYGDGAVDFLELVASLGFDGVQLGPQGATSPDDPSPYAGALFSRNPLSIALAPLTRAEGGGLVRPETLARAVAGRPGPADRVQYAHAWSAVARALQEAFTTFRRGRGAGAADPLARVLDAFRLEQASWLVPDALHHPESPGGAGAYAFVQLLAHEQHRLLRARARDLGLEIFGDFQAGMSGPDALAAEPFLLRGWRMGAPPSRTNPGGQAWGYPVLDPDRYFERGSGGANLDGPALAFVRARARKAFSEYDGLRIDHPHALVCPWVYRDGGPPDAVAHGARLFSSPGVREHPELARFAIAREEQLDPSSPRHADGWVASLTADQVDRYAVLFDAVVEAAREAGREREAIACEILSTQPYPLRRVIERHGLGRFRVTQKADLERADDVYRSENARPEDWVLLGNHDTPPIRLLAESWVASGASRRQAEYLATRLVPADEDRASWVRRVAGDASALVQAKAADLFAGPARQVMIFFADLLGAREIYNEPGTTSPSNWSLRVPPDFRRVYAERVAVGRALDLPRAVARALRSRGRSFSTEHAALIADLERAPP